MLEEIRDLLNKNGINYREVEHEPTKTSAESAEARGEELKTGGKALVLKVDKTFMLFVLSAARKLNSSAIKEYFGSKKLRFANKEELLELTGLVPGSVPPFGRPIINLDLYVDESILQNERIAFNAGSLTNSIIMQVNDYLELTKPQTFNFSEAS